MNYIEKIQHLSELIYNTDAIVIGGGSGLSSAAGYNHYHWSSVFLKQMGVFQEHYGFTSPFAGFYHCFSSLEEQWAYYAAYTRAIQTADIGKPYLDLKNIIGNKPHFIITTNIDGQFERVFSTKHICDFQGNFRYFQCSQPCHDTIYNNETSIEKIFFNINKFRVPSELVPRCPKCGRQMVPWVRDDAFLEGESWKLSLKNYYDFLEKWLLQNNSSKVLLLELGVGDMTPSIIKLPFWEITEKNANVTYVCINKNKSSMPMHIKDKSLHITGDLSLVLEELKKECDKNR